MASTAPSRLLVLNGPNLGLLGTREPHLYGRETLADAEALVAVRAAEFGFGVGFLQSNHEGELIDRLHEGRFRNHGVITNPGGLTHTSVALRDAITGVQSAPSWRYTSPTSMPGRISRGARSLPRSPSLSSPEQESPATASRWTSSCAI